MDTLAFGYILPTTGRIPDLHRLETCAAGRTKKRQISVRENWRAKNSHYYTELHGTIMPMQCYTCPEGELRFFLAGAGHGYCEKRQK